MSIPQSITYVDDQRLVDLIAAASHRVVHMAPGVTEPVATAIDDAWRRLGSRGVTVILDVDAEVCRLGYGTIEGLAKACDAAIRRGVSVLRQPGLRIGLLITDDTTVVYSPTPLLIEAGSNQPQRPNAIELRSPPAEVVKDIGLAEDSRGERAVGLDAVQAPEVAAVKRDLDSAPPVKFDLARRVRVFNARFQFVELELAGCYVSRKKVPIPSSLVGLARNPEVQSQFHAHFNLITKGALQVSAGAGRVVTEESLQKQRQDIARQFLIPLKGYGSVVLRANKHSLEAAVEQLRAQVKLFQDGVIGGLEQSMDANRTALLDALLPAVAANPPPTYTKFHGSGISEAQVRSLLGEDIQRAFGDAKALVGDMAVSLVFKDVAIESLQDERFIAIARAAMPSVGVLHEEYIAAPAGADRAGEQTL